MQGFETIKLKFCLIFSKNFQYLCYCGTSFFAGFVIFGIIGHFAHILGTEVSLLADAGPGLAFIAYPQALALLPGAQFWSIMFFFMLITLGLDSQYAMVETVITGITDRWPHMRAYKSYILGKFLNTLVFK